MVSKYNLNRNNARWGSELQSITLNNVTMKGLGELWTWILIHTIRWKIFLYDRHMVLCRCIETVDTDFRVHNIYVRVRHNASGTQKTFCPLTMCLCQKRCKWKEALEHPRGVVIQSKFYFIESNPKKYIFNRFYNKKV